MQRYTPAQASAHILVVDDDVSVTEMLSMALRFQGYTVDTASHGVAALNRIRHTVPDAVILDLTMPGMDGIEVLRRLRADGNRVPTLCLTGRGTTREKAFGLNVGADDYITKPFSLEEVISRLRAVLKRAYPQRGEIPRRLTFADIEIDQDSREAWKAGHAITLSPREFALLQYFLLNPRKVLKRQEILNHVWRYDFAGTSAAVTSYVSLLRRKIDCGPTQLLHTVPGVGYILRDRN